MAPLQHLRVFLSSPGDVAAERAAAVAVLQRLPYDPLLRGRVTVEIVAWDAPHQPLPLLATRTPQAEIDERLPLPSQCDIVVGILWRRMGTPLPDAFRHADGGRVESGTAWELADALDAEPAPQVLIYRRTPADDEAGDDAVERFLDRLRDPDGSIRGGLNLYADVDNFEPMFEVHLRDLVQRMLGAPAPPVGPAEPRRLDAAAPARVAAGQWLRVRAQVCRPASAGMLGGGGWVAGDALPDVPSSVMPVLFDADYSGTAAAPTTVALRCTAQGFEPACVEHALQLVPGFDSGVAEFALRAPAVGAAIVHVALRQRGPGNAWSTCGMVALVCEVAARPLPAAPEQVARRMLGRAGQLAVGPVSADVQRALARLVALELVGLADVLVAASAEYESTAFSPGGQRETGLALWRRRRHALAAALRDDDALFSHLEAHPGLAPAEAARLVMQRIEPLVAVGTARVLAAMVVRTGLYAFTGRTRPGVSAHA